MSEHRYDAIIVGGGVCGAMVARILSNAGKNVLILEAGSAAAMDPASYQGYVDAYYMAGGRRSTPNGAYPTDNIDSPSPDVLQIGKSPAESYFIQSNKPGLQPFMSDYLRMLGGSTLHWQGTSLRLVPNDFRMRTTYDKGDDWPISYDDLEPNYREAELEIGVAADVEDQRVFGVTFPPGYVYPMHKMPQSVVDQFFIRGCAGLTAGLADGVYPIRTVSIPQGRNSTPNAAYDDGRGYEPVSAIGNRDAGLRCQGNSSCLPICPVQAKYSALKTLRALAVSGHVEIKSQCVVSKLVADPATGRITAVTYKEYPDDKAAHFAIRTARATVVVLAANSIENATLLLGSEVANQSGQVGCNLMDHPYLALWGESPEPVYPFRGPDTTTGVESFRDGAFRANHGAFRASIANWGSPGAPGLQLGNLIDQQVFGRELRRKLRDQLTRLVKLGFMVEQLPSASNRVTIDMQFLDAIGEFKPVLSYRVDDYTMAGMEAAVRVWDAITRATGVRDTTSRAPMAGFTQIPYRGSEYNVMGSGHIVGTHRMGSSRTDSVVDANLRSWDHDNLYLVGAGSMVTCGTANPTLTAVALSARAAHAILRTL